MNKNNMNGTFSFDFARYTASIVSLAVVALVCALQATPAKAQGTDHLVKVLFDANDCPVDTMYNGVKKAFPTLGANKDTVQWQAYDLSGETIRKDAYGVYFDPFRGKFIESRPGRDGSTKKMKSLKAKDIPTGLYIEYKYTIWARECSGPALDPRIRIQ